MRRLLAAAAACVTLAGGGASAAQALDPGQTGLFLVACNFTHRAPDDPIVFMNMPGMAHSHEFFGNTSTDSHSTLASMRKGGTTCQRQEDKSGYWTPTLYKYGHRVPAVMTTVYYTTGRRDPASIQPLPDGLKMIAGDAMAKVPQNTYVVHWDCGHPGAMSDRALGRGKAMRRLHRAKARVKRLSRVLPGSQALRKARRRLRMARMDVAPSALPTCAPGHRVHLNLRFPDCWDGKRLDSHDHKSHMAYSPPINGPRGCPASHPVPVPVLTFSISWPIADGEGVRLASGSVKTMHGDVFSAWDPGTQEAIVARCLRTDTDCEAN